MGGKGGLTRRELIELGILGSLAGGVGARPAAARARERKAGGSGPTRNIIFMVSDGMSWGVPSMAEPFARQVQGRGTAWHELLCTPGVVHGLFETHSLSSLVTDSAAASSAWATGSRVFNGALNLLPDGRRLVPIGALARDRGRRVGLVTTTRITHATPAGFAVVQANRDDEDLIAPQYLGEVDVLLGGGRKHFDAGARDDGHDLIAEFTGQGYTFWERREEVCGPARPEKVLGLFADSHIPYTIDHRNRGEISRRVPTLAEMTRAALEILQHADEGFLLQVEGGRVDHAAHANDAAALLWDQLAFDDAIRVVRAFVAEHPDTLVIVTSDHGNANPGLNGMGPDYRDSSACFERLAAATVSFELLVERFGDARKPSPVELKATFATDFGVTLGDDEAEAVAAAVGGQLPPELSAQHRNVVGVLGQVLGNHTGVGWTGVVHTQDMVITTSFGSGAERCAGVMHLTDAYAILTEVLGVTHRNPSMSPEEAQRYLARAAGAPAPRAHWA